MTERKNIDRVFQENLRDLEIDPGKRVWNNIERELTGRSSVEPVALWRKIGAVAAVLVAFFSTGLFYFNSVGTSNPAIDVSSVSQEEPANSDKINTPVIELVNNGNDLASNNDGTATQRKKGKAIVTKKSSPKVIVTSNDITSVYTSIDNKYIVDKEAFLEEMDDEVTIASRINDIPVKQVNAQESKKWSVGPSVAPVFFNSLQSGSPINQSLADNAKTSENALSVGVKVNYQLNDKFYIQSGVNRVELAYNTKGVNAFITSSKNPLTNINTDRTGVILRPSSSAANPEAGVASKSSVSGDLNQSIEYVELPVEMKYNLYDKRFGFNLVGGFSTMILSGNSVSMVSQNQITDLGEANNLNSLNFSGNLGVDLDYKISNSWYLNVAPMFKYQFNTFSSNSGNFRPYYFGLYSGLNYRF